MENTLHNVHVTIAPFTTPKDEIVLVLTAQDGQLVARVVATPFYVTHSTDATPLPSNFSALRKRSVVRWSYGVHRASWPSIVYAQGVVLIAVDHNGRWVGECDVPPDPRYVQRARMALWELLTTGDAHRAEHIAQGPWPETDMNGRAAVVLMVRPHPKASTL